MGESAEVMNGLHRLRLDMIRYVGHVNCYLLQTSANSFLLMDTGLKDSSPQLMDALHSTIAGENRISHVTLSHMHPDHYGGTRSVLEAYQSKLAYHPEEKRLIHLASQLARQRDSVFAEEYGISNESARPFQELAEEFRNAPAQSDLSLNDGQVIRATNGEWTVVHTPGHTPGHVCLFDKASRVLLSGDHLLPNETPNVPYYPLPGYRALEAYLKSLLKIRTLSPRLVLPAHGDAFSNAAERISYLLDHHRSRLKEIFELMTHQASPEEIASGVAWSRGKFEQLAVLDKWLAISETISHLEFLCDTGVCRQVNKPRLTYALVQNDWAHVERKYNEMTMRMDQPKQVRDSKNPN
jgi:glyoxylase-like metal-dependent hydrolase (beta-lactamase superfamily II)